MVMETEVFGSQRSKPLYNFFASSTVAMLTPRYQSFHKYQGDDQGPHHKVLHCQMRLIIFLQVDQHLHNENVY
jgi:hypothetical protein